MSITSQNDYFNSVKQNLDYCKTASATTVAGLWFSLFDLAGFPAAGVLAGANTANGVVPTDAVAGYLPINAFAGGAVGYLTRFEASSSVAARLRLYDRLFLAGAYSFNSNVSLASQPSYSSRVPSADYKGLQIWIEVVTAFTGNPTITITYTNQDGTTGKSTSISITAPTIRRAFQVPLASGDTGVQKIESVVATIATVGTFNVIVLRPLAFSRIRSANDGEVQDLFKTGLKRVYDDSALYLLVSADSTSSGIPEAEIEIANN